MKIFITGATGYIGSSLANKLISSGNIVHALVRDVSAAQKLLHATTSLPMPNYGVAIIVYSTKRMLTAHEMCLTRPCWLE
jgi:thioester reductase-like protein